MSATAEVEALLKLALATQNAQGEDFVQKVDLYLNAFDKWQAKLESDSRAGNLVPVAEQESFKAAVQRLTAVHQGLVSQANQEKDTVAEELGALHKRAQGLKSYVDRYPQRISVTGKRKG